MTQFELFTDTDHNLHHYMCFILFHCTW